MQMPLQRRKISVTMITRCPPTYGHTYIHVCLEADQEDFFIHNQAHLILCPPNSNSGLGGDSSRRRNGLNEEEMIFCEDEGVTTA